jgi:hypothetical protein
MIRIARYVMGDPPLQSDFEVVRNTDPSLVFVWTPRGVFYDYTNNTASFVVYPCTEDFPLATLTTTSSPNGLVTLGLIGTATAGQFIAQLSAAFTHMLSHCTPVRYKAYVKNVSLLTTCLAFGEIHILA